MKTYVKRPITITAVVWTGSNTEEITEFTEGGAGFETLNGKLQLLIPTLEGDMRAKRGDYIIRGVDGEFYPCRKDIFERTYEEE